MSQNLWYNWDMSTQERESLMKNHLTINELARELNRSTSDWLDTWGKATTLYRTAEDLEAFRVLVTAKLEKTQQLLDLIDQEEV